MNTRILLLATLVALPVAALGADANEASKSDTAKPAAEQPVARKPAADKPLADASSALKKTVQDCPTSATRIRKPGCDGPTPYRSFSKDQMDTTGRIDMAEALRELDPIFQ